GNNVNEGQELIDLWDQAHYCIAEKEKNRTLTSLEKFRIRQKNLPPESICPLGKRRKISHSKKAVQILNSWFEDNSHYPYPSRAIVEDLCKRCGLSDKQIKTWFANARRKLKDPGLKQVERNIDSSYIDALDSHSTPKDLQKIHHPDFSNTTSQPRCLEDQVLRNVMSSRGNFEAPVGPFFHELAEPRVNIIPPLKLPHGMNSGRPSVILSWFREGLYSSPPSISPRYFHDNSYNLNTPLQGENLCPHWAIPGPGCTKDE
ncbi:homeobox protein six1a-like, partial [Actinia tenebrosa]|uniref:Homeobox protein six1a-like n=1 Tax=Actinia tenebrosa TaxID=6105 RepID=A0A6P8H516_ACTTE